MCFTVTRSMLFHEDQVNVLRELVLPGCIGGLWDRGQCGRGTAVCPEPPPIHMVPIGLLPHAAGSVLRVSWEFQGGLLPRVDMRLQRGSLRKSRWDCHIARIFVMPSPALGYKGALQSEPSSFQYPIWSLVKHIAESELQINLQARKYFHGSHFHRVTGVYENRMHGRK